MTKKYIFNSSRESQESQGQTRQTEQTSNRNPFYQKAEVECIRDIKQDNRTNPQPLADDCIEVICRDAVPYGIIKSLKSKLTVFSFENKILPPKLESNPNFFEAINSLKEEMHRIKERNRSIPYWIVIKAARNLVNGALDPEEWAERYDENKIVEAKSELRRKCVEFAKEYKHLKKEFDEEIAIAAIGEGRYEANIMEKRKQWLLNTGFIQEISLLSCVSDDYFEDAKRLARIISKNGWDINNPEKLRYQLASYCLNKI